MIGPSLVVWLKQAWFVVATLILYDMICCCYLNIIWKQYKKFEEQNLQGTTSSDYFDCVKLMKATFLFCFFWK